MFEFHDLLEKAIPEIRQAQPPEQFSEPASSVV
jgi:hypothetical protein